MAYQQQRGNPSSEDYCGYVKRMDRKTSMCEGPHFPNMFTTSKAQDRKADEKTTKEKNFTSLKVDEKTTKEKNFTSLGLFGRAEHVGYEYDVEMGKARVE